jgi:hypothetical protein
LISDYAKKESQVVEKLVAANLKFLEMSSVILLSDLRKDWVFMWLSEDNTIRQLALKQPANAFDFIDFLSALISSNS